MEIPLRGVRFYGDGFPGLAVLHDPEWRISKREDLIRSLIAVDVAGIVAENVMNLLHDDCEELDPYLSSYFDDGTERCVPSDLADDEENGADDKAKILATALFERDGKTPSVKEFFKARREIIEQAETDATKVLRDNLAALKRLTCELTKRPMTGTAIKRIIAEAQKS